MVKDRPVPIGNRRVGRGEPVYVIAEIGINHNGSLDLAKQLIEGSARAGCDAVKFQKRTPELCVPREQWEVKRDTPWGRITYLEYRHRVEFGVAEYLEIDAHCRMHGIQWFASCWDERSVEFMEAFAPVCYKISSASLTDAPLREKLKSTGRPVIVSTGMSTMEEIDEAVAHLGRENLLIAHSTSAYPCPVGNLNLRAINTLQDRFPECPVGYSGHETGLVPTWAAVTLGACFVERHVTLDRSMWGTDQAASVELVGMQRLVANIRDVEKAVGDGVKKVYDCEIPNLEKLRRVKTGDSGAHAVPQGTA